jgi:hypothetical protein
MTNRRQDSSVLIEPPRQKSRTYNLRLIRRDHCSTVQEIAELFRVHANAVRRWVKDGLKTIDCHRPQLIHGTDLIEYLQRRQRGRRHRCAPDEMYCFTCRKPRRPAGGRVTLVQLRPLRILIQGSCETCGTALNRASSTARLAELERTFTVTTASPHLDGTSPPILMCDLGPGE